MEKFRALGALGLIATIFLAGCASYTDETKEIRSEFQGGQYAKALTSLEKSEIKTQSRNRLLYRLEKAMILDRMGQRAKARALLIEADKIADELYTVSVSKTAASFLYNDSATDYAGEDYEKVAIHTEMALSFIADQDYAAARVEAAKINNSLSVINQAYGDKKNRYAEDAFARYLSGIIYEARGESDDAIIDYNRALNLYAGEYSRYIDGGVPDSLVEALTRLYIKRGRDDRLAQLEKKYPKIVSKARGSYSQEKDYAQVIVVHELGHIATKSTEEFVLPIGKQVIRFSFPVIKKRTQAYRGGTGVSVYPGGAFKGADNVQDMDAIARDTLEDRRFRMVAKQTGRLLAKGQLTEQAYKNFGLIGGLAANVYSAVSETADTRSWTLLPEAYFVTRLWLKSGKYDLKFKTAGRQGETREVNLRANEVRVFRDTD
jgi:hypothetical protein